MNPLRRQVPEGPSQACSSRVNDLLLGGRASCAADRALARKLGPDVPSLATAVYINRVHNALTGAYLAAEHGYHQFLDLGCGHPASHHPSIPELHEAVAPHKAYAQVVYVDSDPSVVAHVRTGLAGRPGDPAVIHADIRQMRELLDSDDLFQYLDPVLPIAVTLHDVLLWTGTDEETTCLMADLRDWLPPPAPCRSPTPPTSATSTCPGSRSCTAKKQALISGPGTVRRSQAFSATGDCWIPGSSRRADGTPSTPTPKGIPSAPTRTPRSVSSNSSNPPQINRAPPGRFLCSSILGTSSNAHPQGDACSGAPAKIRRPPSIR